jgi:hypothetical protein
MARAKAQRGDDIRAKARHDVEAFRVVGIAGEIEPAAFILGHQEEAKVVFP